MSKRVKNPIVATEGTVGDDGRAIVSVSDTMKPISQRAFRFVDAIVRTNSPAEAAREAGITPRMGHVLLNDPRVQHAIEARRQALADMSNVDAVWVLQQWVQLATADPTKVLKIRRLCCRWCHGIDHQYQWTPREYAEVSAKAMDEGKIPPSPSGGVNFDFTLDPNPDCPECRGEGVEDLHVEDLRFLTGPERLLVAGVKKTREGIEVKFRDQDGALAKIAEYLGMLVKPKPGENPRTPGLPQAEEVLSADELRKELQQRGLPISIFERLSDDPS